MFVGQLSLTGHPDSRSGSFPAPQFSNANSSGYILFVMTTTRDKLIATAKILSTEIRTSIHLVLVCFFSNLSFSHRHRASHVFILKDEQRFNGFWKDSNAAPIALSLGKGLPQNSNSSAPSSRSQSPTPSYVQSISVLHSLRPSALGQGVSVKEGVTVPRNNMGSVSQGMFAAQPSTRY